MESWDRDYCFLDICLFCFPLECPSPSLPDQLLFILHEFFQVLFSPERWSFYPPLSVPEHGSVTYFTDGSDFSRVIKWVNGKENTGSIFFWLLVQNRFFLIPWLQSSQLGNGDNPCCLVLGVVVRSQWDSECEKALWKAIHMWGRWLLLPGRGLQSARWLCDCMTSPVPSCFPASGILFPAGGPQPVSTLPQLHSTQDESCQLGFCFCFVLFFYPCTSLLSHFSQALPLLKVQFYSTLNYYFSQKLRSVQSVGIRGYHKGEKIWSGDLNLTSMCSVMQVKSVYISGPLSLGSKISL